VTTRELVTLEAGDAALPVADRRAAWRRIWAYRNPSLLPVVVLWVAIVIGVVAYGRTWSPSAPGLLGSNDWLINYEGGFVRRGLAGELLYLVHQALGFSSLTQDLLVLQTGLYVAVGVVVSILALRIRNRLLPWVLLSPAAFLFSSYSVLGGFRKDLLLFLGLGLLALAARTTHVGWRWTWCVAGSLLYVVFVLSWEAGILFLPLVVAFLFEATRSLASRWPTLLTGAVVGVSLVGFALELLHPGNTRVVSGICDSLRRAGIPYHVNCLPGGSGILGIAWLQLSWHDSAHQVAALWPGYGFYVVWLAIGLAPFVVSRWLPRHLVVTALAVGAVLPLFVVGSDYGRWVHLAVTCLTLYWLMTAEDQPDAGRPRGALELVTLAAWVTCWSVPYWKDPFLVGGFWNALDVSGMLHAFQQYVP
jgi:hypothetical protein